MDMLWQALATKTHQQLWMDEQRSGHAFNASAVACSVDLYYLDQAALLESVPMELCIASTAVKQEGSFDLTGICCPLADAVL
jgi:hypothetical protein